MAGGRSHGAAAATATAWKSYRDTESPSSEIRKYAARQRLTCNSNGEGEGKACRFEARLLRCEDQRGKEKGFPDRRVAYRTTHFI